jgi:hypothetical protein
MVHSGQAGLSNQVDRTRNTPSVWLVEIVATASTQIGSICNGLAKCPAACLPGRETRFHGCLENGNSKAGFMNNF